MKILVVGLGSIGKRHLSNLLSLSYKDISVVTRSKLPAEFSGICSYGSIEDAFNQFFFDTVFICTPTSQHISSLTQLLLKRVENIYVEKPLGHNIQNIQQVLTLASAYKNNIVVGYDLHFDPGIEKVRELLLKNVIGKIVSVNAFVGQYLPDWRPHEDHRKGMSAKKETGGGVLLDIVHEFDYVCWLTGAVEDVACFHINHNILEIETEEVAEVMLKFSNGAIGSIHLDYLQRTLVRYCIFTGTNGSINCDLAQKKVSWINEHGQIEEFSYPSFERNERFKIAITAFLENNADDRLTSLQEALKSLAVVEAAKKSAGENTIVKLSSLKYS